MTRLTRRKALAALGGSILGGLPTVRAQTPGGRAAPLTIDVHTHIFNATDLQAARFLEYVHFLDTPWAILGPLLDAVGHFAPLGLQELDFLAHAGAQPSRGNLWENDVVRREADAQFQKIKTGLLQEYLSLKNSDLRFQTEAGIELGRQIQLLQSDPTYESYKLRRRNSRHGRDIVSVAAATVDFLTHNLQYRYVNATDYLQEYSSGPRKVDLMIAHMVDYDFPLGKTSTRTPLVQQVAVMEKISGLTNGRVHAYVPFCPFKRVAFTLGLTSEDPLDLVKKAISNHGHIGVKIYPPMGFRPYGNSELDTFYASGSSFWSDDFLLSQSFPALSKRTDLGSKIDNALSELYSWCAGAQAPIMAHTAPSCFPVKKYETYITSPVYWEALFDQPYFGELRINFGHFGNTDIVTHVDDQSGIQRASELTNYMQRNNKLFADSAYLHDVLIHRADLEAQLRPLFEDSTGKGDAALSHRLMYGTDWEMVIVEGGTTDYLTDFEKLIGDLAQDKKISPSGDLADLFFGINAAAYLGLGPSGATRSRLERFYEAGGGAKPDWMAKVDALPNGLRPS